MPKKSTAIMQYILIYIMLLIPGSCFFAVYLQGNSKYIAVLGLFAILFISNKKYRDIKHQYGLIFSVFLLFVIFFVRMLVGGVGVAAWFQYAVCLLCVQFVINCDHKYFLTRFIRLTVLMAAISIVFWALFCIMPSLVKAWPAERYFVQSIGTGRWAIDWYGKGLFLYSHLEIHPFRNCGIYTEPGVYQIVLNSALFVLLFWKNKLILKSYKQYKMMLGIILIALVSCQSTTGYISMLCILLFFYLFSRDKSKFSGKIKRYVLTLSAVAVIVLLVDLAISGEGSILYKQIIHKLFNGGNSIDISEGTGQYRMITIKAGLYCIFNYPLGAGYNRFNLIRAMYGDGSVAASFVGFAAIYGIIPWIISMWNVFYPAFKRERWYVAVLFVIMFVNTTLGQTDLFYPTLMLIPMYLLSEKHFKRKISYSEILDGGYDEL